MNSQLKEIQQLELDILIEIDKFCRRHGIKYSLAAGTMLGAVRHGGFIPWDDDIDLVMHRVEYEKFIHCAEEYKDEIPAPYKVKIMTDKDYFYPFIKVVNADTIVEEELIEEKFPLGVWVDVFPLDSCDSSEYHEKRIIHSYMEKTRELQRFVAKDKSVLKAFARKLYLRGREIFFGRRWEKVKEELMESPDVGDGKYVGLFSWPLYDTLVFKREWMEEYMPVQFEGKTFYMFSEYDTILSEMYGEYMTLPPLEKRKSHHISYKFTNNR